MIECGHGHVNICSKIRWFTNQIIPHTVKTYWDSVSNSEPVIV